MATTTGTHP
jgi:hypothetical protein